MRVGIVGTGAIALKHAQAYKNIGYSVTVCTNATVARGQHFADVVGAEFVTTAEQLCQHPHVDFVDVCTPPSYRLPVVELCADSGKGLIVQKPMAIDLETAARMIVLSREAEIQLGVVSQHRFDDSVLFIKRALTNGRLGKILQADAYVKWYRTEEYYSRASKGTWAGDGGGALISQAIHQVDLLLYLIGPVNEVSAYWQLGALHDIKTEDVLNTVLSYSSGATGVVQASTAFWPGYPERLEIHGSKGTAIITGDQLTTWDVQDDTGEPPPVACEGASGGSDPMAISVLPLERQLLDFGESCKVGKRPACTGTDGFRALQLVHSIYTSCSEGRRVRLV